MHKVAFFGRKEVALACLKRVLALRDAGLLDLVGVLSTPHVLDTKDIPALCRERGAPLLASLDEYLALERVDILVSVQYERILQDRHLAKARELNLNLHMAPLPEYRGCNQFSWAIMDGAKEFGATLHRMDTRIDHGDILFERRFAIPPDCWVEDLYELTRAASVELFQESFEAILRGDIVPTPQQQLLEERGTSLHLRKDIETLKHIDLAWDPEIIQTHVRATSMPGFAPPYYVQNGQPVYLVPDRYTLRDGRLAHKEGNPS